MNPRARPEFVDDVTGVPTRPGPGTRPSGRVVARVRTSPDAAPTTVAVEPDELDYSRSSIPILAARLDDVLDRARDDARYASRRAPLKRSEFALEEGKRSPGPKLLAALGMRSTFDSPEKGAEELSALGEWDTDTGEMVDPDLLAEWVSERSVDTGSKTKKLSRGRYAPAAVVADTARKTVSLAKTPAGRRILGQQTGALGTNGGAVFRRAVIYLLGRATGRRWSAVDWWALESLVDVMNEAIDQAKAGGLGRGERLIPYRLVMPLGAGPAAFDNYREAIRDQLGDAALAEFQILEEAARLWSIADDLRWIAKPPKGPDGAKYRELRKCVAPADLARLPRRIKQIEHLAASPWEMPPTLCDLEKLDHGLPCHLGPLTTEAARLRGACGREPNRRRRRAPAGRKKTGRKRAENPGPVKLAQLRDLAELGRLLDTRVDVDDREAVLTGKRSPLLWSPAARALVVFAGYKLPAAKPLDDRKRKGVKVYETWTRGREASTLRAGKIADLPKGPWQLIGPARTIGYSSDKFHDKGESVDYEHKFGAGVKLYALGDATQPARYRVLLWKGGRLRITQDGIEG